MSLWTFGEFITLKAKTLLGDKKKPLIQRRLDYCFISDSLQDDVVKTDIITAINTNNLAFVLGVNSLAEYPRCPSFWKFNNSPTGRLQFCQMYAQQFFYLAW